MGQSSSRSRRRDDDRQTYSHHAPLPPPPSSPPPALTPPYNPSSRPNFSNPYYNYPPTPAVPYYYAYQQQPSSNYNGLMGFIQSWVNNAFPSSYRPNQGNVWWNSAAPPPPAAMPPYSSFSAASSSSTVVTPPPYVEHQKGKTIKNDVNVHKDMIRLEVDAHNPEEYLVSFVYDAIVDGSITIYYLAKEGDNCSFSSIEEDIYKPRSYPFEKGTGKTFCQPSGHGIDLGFFELDRLSKPANGEVFPLVIYANANGPTLTDGQSVQSAPTRVQITLAVIETNNKGAFEVKVVKQILWIDGDRYELQQIFGLASSSSEPIDDGDDDIGKECVICMSEPRNTAVLPCRHLCMCSDCAKSFRVQLSKCPICRQPVEKLMEINVNATSSDR